ncbi:hypothetical protein [Pseudonocardia sp. HH130630-07]|uniref:hypothetical protein n=1 Tax=Pseudonocardia sp. HH130630-07 TaxID=1690815 RepID=UPI0012EA8EF1|nr:hypothetical protein [Pseudonocardia sp. HH130630-07]
MHRTTVRTITRTGALAAAVAALGLVGGCGLLGESWDVRMEVTGPGTAQVGTKFAGEPDLSADGQGRQSATLPFSESRNVGFGFNDLAVEDAAPGTVCRIFVNDELRSEHPVDQAGSAWCDANNQERE